MAGKGLVVVELFGVAEDPGHLVPSEVVGLALRGSAYDVRLRGTTVSRCLRCAIMNWPTVRRSLLSSLIVGTVITAINQGTLIVQGDLSVNLAWQVPLTYLVPYCVATTGAILNARRTEIDDA